MKIVAAPIDAVVYFRGKQKPMPYKFKYESADSIIREVKVDQVIQVEERKLAGIKTFIYSCQSLMGNEMKRYELKYIVAECRWELYKI